MSMRKIQVSYVGVNNLFGRVASSLLQQTPGIKKLYLYDETDVKRKESTQEPVVAEFCGRNNLPQALENADLIVVGDESEVHLHGASSKLKSVAKRIYDYIEILGAVKRSAKPPIIVVASSPLNVVLPLMAEALEREQLFDPERLFGATSGDTFRASVLLANHMRTQPDGVVVPVVGGSSYDTRVPLFSQMHPQLALSEETRDKLTHKTKSLDQEAFNVTEVIERAYTTVRFLSSIIAGLQGKRNVPEISLVHTDQHPDVRFLSVPVILGKCGVERCINIPKLSPSEEDMLEKAVKLMKEDALTAKNLLREIKAERNSPKLKCDFYKTEKFVTDVDVIDFNDKECIEKATVPFKALKGSNPTHEMKQLSFQPSKRKEIVAQRVKSVKQNKQPRTEPSLEPMFLKNVRSSSQSQNKTVGVATERKRPEDIINEKVKTSSARLTPLPQKKTVAFDTEKKRQEDTINEKVKACSGRSIPQSQNKTVVVDKEKKRPEEKVNEKVPLIPQSQNKIVVFNGEKRRPKEKVNKKVKASGGRLINRKRGRSLRRHKKRWSYASSAPQVTEKSSPKILNKSNDSSKSNEAPISSGEPIIPPKKAAEEKIDEKTISSSDKSENKSFNKKEERATQYERVVNETTPTGLAKADATETSEQKRVENENSDELKMCNPKNQTETRKVAKPSPKTYMRKLSSRMRNNIQTSDKTEGGSTPKSEAKSQNEPQSPEKFRKVTSFSYSAFVDSLPQHMRPTIEPPIEFCSVESPSPRSQTLKPEMNPGKPLASKEQKKEVTRFELTAKRNKPLKSVRKQSSGQMIATQQPATVSSETKKYERFRHFAGIFEKVKISAEVAEKNGAKESIDSSTNETKEGAEKMMNEATTRQLEHKRDFPEFVPSEKPTSVKEFEGSKKKESEFRPEENVMVKSVKEFQPPDEAKALGEKNEMPPSSKSEIKKEEESRKPIVSKYNSSLQFESQPKSPLTSKTPAKSGRSEKCQSSDSNVKQPLLQNPSSKHKTPSHELAGNPARPEDSAPDKTKQSQSPQQQISHFPRTLSNQEQYKHEKKSSAYMKMALQKFSPQRTQEPKVKPSPRHNGKGEPKNRLSKLHNVHPVPKKALEDTNIPKKVKPAPSNHQKIPPKNYNRAKRDPPSKHGDLSAKPSSTERVASEFKSSLNPSQLTSDKGKHEATNSVNFKVHTVTVKPNSHQADGQSNQATSMDRNQPFNTVKHLIVNQKVTLARNNAADSESSEVRKKCNYLDNLKPIDQTNDSVTNDTKWGKIFHVFRQVLKNDLKREEDRKSRKKAPKVMPEKLDMERRRSRKKSGRKDRESTVMVNVSSETFKPSQGCQSKACPTKLKTYFSRRGNTGPNPLDARFNTDT